MKKGASKRKTPSSGPVRFILDTSIFTNPEVYRTFGTSPLRALKNFLELAEKARGVEFYMPPSIFEELKTFISPGDMPGEFLVVVRRKPPKKHELAVPAFLLYELIEDVRKRVDRGLRVAEGIIKRIQKAPRPEDITTLRRKYREALREGIIDSKEDVELILLARELEGGLVTADRGIITWAEKLGISWTDSRRFKEKLDVLIEKGPAP